MGEQPWPRDDAAVDRLLSIEQPSVSEVMEAMLPISLRHAFREGRAPTRGEREEAAEDAVVDGFDQYLSLYDHDPWKALCAVVSMVVSYAHQEYDIRPGARPTIRPELRRQVFERDEYRCRDCGGWEFLTVDHVIPFVFGGPTVIENLQTLCRSCNSRKGARL